MKKFKLLLLTATMAVVLCALVFLVLPRLTGQNQMNTGNTSEPPIPLPESFPEDSNGLTCLDIPKGTQWIISNPEFQLRQKGKAGAFLSISKGYWWYGSYDGLKNKVLDSGSCDNGEFSLYYSGSRLKFSPDCTKVFSISGDKKDFVCSSLPQYKEMPIAEVFTDGFSRAGGHEALQDYSIISGNWQIKAVAEPQYSASPCFLNSASLKGGVLTAGRKEFRDYLLKAAICTGDKPLEFGLILCSSDKGEIRLRWEKVQDWYGNLIVSDSNENEVLFSRPMRLNSNQWYEFSGAIHDQTVYFSLDSYPIYSGAVSLNSGKFGFFAEGRGIKIDDVFVTPLHDSDPAYEYMTGWQNTLVEEKSKASAISPAFYSDKSNSSWAALSADWKTRRGRGRKGLVLSSKRVYRDDFAVCMRIRNAGEIPSRIELLNSPQKFSLSVGKALRISFNSTDERAGSVDFPIEAGVFPLQLTVGIRAVKEGRQAYAIFNRQLEPICLLGDQKVSGSILVNCEFKVPQSIKVLSSGVRDYSFATAPVDFQRYGGEWFVSSRWACSPQYSWLGGRADPLAMLASKYKLEGDIDFSCTVAPLMQTYMRPGYRNPCKIAFEFSDILALNSGFGLKMDSRGKGNLFGVDKTYSSRGFSYYGYNSNHWFHNVWLNQTITTNGNTVKGSTRNSSNLSGQLRRKVPSSLYIFNYGNDFSFARLTLSADKITISKPVGLDEEPLAFYEPKYAGRGKHLLTDEKVPLKSETSSAVISWKEIDGYKALSVTPAIDTGVFKLSPKIVSNVYAQENSVWSFLYDGGENTPYCLRFEVEGTSYFIPLDGSADFPPYLLGYKVDEGFISRSELTLPGAECRKLSRLNFYAELFAKWVSTSMEVSYSAIRFSTEHYDPHAATTIPNTGEFKLYCADFLVPAAKHWKDRTEPGERLEVFDPMAPVSLWKLEDGRLLQALKPSPGITFDADLDDSTIEVCIPSVEFSSKTELEIATHENKHFAVPSDCIEIRHRGDITCLAVDLNKLSPQVSLGGRFIVRVLASKQYTDSGEFSFADFINADKHAPAFSISSIVPFEEDNGDEPWLKSYGSSNALFPRIVSETPVRTYIASKRALGGFSGMSIDLPRRDLRMYPVLVGKYTGYGDWDLDFSAKRSKTNFKGWQSASSLSTKASKNWHKSSKMFGVSLTKVSEVFPVTSKITLGDFFFTSGQEDWCFMVSDLQLVSCIRTKDIQFKINASDISGVDGYEFYYEKTTLSSLEIPKVEDTAINLSKDGEINLTGLSTGLFWLGVRAVDKKGNRSDFQWKMFYHYPSSYDNASIDSITTIGSDKFPTELKIITRDVSPAFLTVSMNGVKYSVNDGSIELKEETVASSQLVSTFVIPLKGKGIGAFKVEVSARGYQGSEDKKEFTFVRDCSEMASSVFANSSVEPIESLISNDFEYCTGDAMGRRGAVVAISDKRAAGGNHSLMVKAISDWDYFSAFLHNSKYSLNDYPMIEFDYFGGNAMLSLMVKFGGNFYDIQLGNRRIPMQRVYNQNGRFRINGTLGYSSGVIGTFAGDTRNLNKWIHVRLNLLELLEKAIPDHVGEYEIESISLRATGPNQEGAEAFVDNLIIWKKLSNATVSWSYTEPEAVESCKVLVEQMQDGKTWWAQNRALKLSSEPMQEGKDLGRECTSINLLSLKKGKYRITVFAKVGERVFEEIIYADVP